MHVEQLLQIRQVNLQTLDLLLFWFQRGFNLIGFVSQYLLLLLQVLDFKLLTVQLCLFFLEILLSFSLCQLQFIYLLLVLLAAFIEILCDKVQNLSLLI